LRFGAASPRDALDKRVLRRGCEAATASGLTIKAAPVLTGS